jgi:hypothetical protein
VSEGEKRNVALVRRRRVHAEEDDRSYALYTAFPDEMHRFATSYALASLRQDPEFGARLAELGGERVATTSDGQPPVCASPPA